MSIRERIVDLINSQEYKPMLKEELLVHFDLDSSSKKEFYMILNSLEKEGLIIKASNERYGSLNSEYLVVGKLEGHDRGFGFVVPEDTDRDDVFIPAENMNSAMHGDKVIANIIKRSEAGKRQEGAIVRVLERVNTSIVGTFEKSKSFGFVIPDNPKIAFDIFIPKSMINGAKDKQKVVIEITKWPGERRNPEGRVVEILGYISEKGTDILSVIRQFQLPEAFPNEVKDYAKSIPNKVSEEEIKSRVDYRNLKTFTIDGADAKDLDDAISIYRLDNGNYELGVHIADVSHYVREDSIIDEEAYSRGNSVYLIDRVVPMLPEELSNGICSLNQGEDRLTLSVVMEIDKSGTVVKHRVEEAVINSKARLVYNHVSDYIENKDDPDFKPDKSICDLLKEIDLMSELMEILYAKRERRGSINFDFPETMIVLDENGRTKDILKMDRRVANKMIEEFMLVTNETIAEEYYWAETPFLYRIHEEPSEERMAIFSKFIYNLGYNLKGQEIHPKELQLLTKEIKGKKEEDVISTLLLRSLKKAKYSSECDIHFGLASQHYSHFTAPIRRYPDLVIHRIIKENIEGKLSLDKQEKLEVKLPEIAKHTSMTERRAEEAEREVEDLKKTQYMRERLGEEYDGVVSSLTNFGMFVQLDNTVEGLVHFNSMTDDFYHFDEVNHYMVGERTNKKYRLGDVVKVRVAAADLAKRTIDFQLLDKIKEDK